MRYEMNFGSVKARGGAVKPGDALRVAILGDFSGRANRGELETGEGLAKRKGHDVDVDNLDEVLGRFGVKMTLPIGDGSVEVEIGEMDDFHPDELFDNLELFEELAALRRRLDGSKWESAAKEMADWAGEMPKRKKKPASKKSRGSSVPVRKLSDFDKLVGRSTTSRDPGASDADELVKSVVAPFAVAARDAAQDELIAKVDEALSDAMRSVLHHPDFQTMESAWRSVDLLTRQLETGQQLRLTLYDVSAEELAADLASADDLTETGIYKMLVEEPASDAQRGPIGLVCGLYTFERTPPHADLLGRIANVAAAGRMAFVSGISNDVVTPVKLDDIHHLTREAWDGVRALPQARHVGLACPRFMLRLPYGQKTDPIDPFEFEEFTKRTGVGSMLWANGALLATLFVAQSFAKDGMGSMRLGSVTTLGDVPYHWFTDGDGDQVALPCTDRLVTEKILAWLVSQGFMPVVSMRGRNEVKLGSFQSLGDGMLAGPWTPEEETQPEPEPEPEPEAADEPDDDDDASDDSDDDLDALLSEFDDDSPDDDDSDSDDDDSDDDDSGSDDDSSDDESDDDEMDPELAALLADL